MRAGADALRGAAQGADPFERGRAALARGDPEAARDAFEAALVDDPFSAPAHAALAELDRRAGRLDAAIAHYRTALVRYPDAPELLLRFAAVLLESGERDEGRTMVERVLARDPVHADALALRARLDGEGRAE
jgi:Tfp pilus assembly protein PilF